jgi:hypothetical protein
MRFDGVLVCEQAVKRAIEAILVDLLLAELQQITKRRTAIPVLGDVQLARQLAEPRHNQHARQLRPSGLLTAHRQQPPAQLLKPHPAP